MHQAEYIPLTLGEVMQHLDEEPAEEEEQSNQEKFNAIRDKAIEVMREKGRDCRLKDSDCHVQVQINEEAGEEEWDEGLKYRKDVFDLKWQEGSQKRRDFGKFKQVMGDDGKIWIYVFKQQEGVNYFKLFKKKSALKKHEVGDSQLNSAEDQNKVFQAVSNKMLNHEEKGRVISKDLGTGVDLEQATQQKAETIKLGRNASTSSSGGSDALRGPLGGAAAGTNKKKQEQGRR